LVAQAATGIYFFTREIRQVAREIPMFRNKRMEMFDARKKQQVDSGF
jgi:dTDP-glucose pyrophosphorylase